MLHAILQGMEKATNIPEGETNARAFMYNEWARLFLKTYEPGRKIIYTTVYAFPMEILQAFDIAPFDFEVAGTLLCTTDFGTQVVLAAEEQGYSTDICSFHRNALGAYYQGILPRPDLLISTSFYCDSKMKTNQILSSLCGAEAQTLSVPSIINRESIDYVEKQLRHIAGRIEAVTGQRLNEEKFINAIRSSNRARRLHLKLLELLKKRPMLWSGYQLLTFSILARMFTGSEIYERLYELIIGEIEQRFASGELPPERHRVFWFAWFPSYRSNIFDVFREHQVSVPFCETLRMYWDEIDEKNPFTGLALRCLQDPFVGSVDRRTQGLKDIVEQYGISGALLFATPACRHANSTNRILKDAAAECGLPFLTLDLDISDRRAYAPAQVKTRLESFIELMDQRRAG